MIGRRTPLNLPGAKDLKSWLRPSSGVVMLATLDKVGTASAPAVTFTEAVAGSLTQALEIMIDVIVGGPRGTATFDWYLRGVKQNVGGPVATAASVALTGTGLNAAFGTGTDYNADNEFHSVVSTLTDYEGTVWDGESGAASVRPRFGNINGRTTWKFNGTTNRLRTTANTLPRALVGGDDTPNALAFVYRYNGPLTPTVVAPVLGMCDGSTGDPGFYDFGVASSGAWNVGKRGDTSPGINRTGGVADNAPHRALILNTGTAAALYIDAVLVALSSGGALNVPALTASPDFFMLGGLSASGVGTTEFYASCDIGDVISYAGNQSLATLMPVDQYLKNFYGL